MIVVLFSIFRLQVKSATFQFRINCKTGLEIGTIGILFFIFDFCYIHHKPKYQNDPFKKTGYFKGKRI